MWIAAAQSPVSREPARNGLAIRALMREAHEAGARLIQFPEGALSGYPTRQDEDWRAVERELAETAALAATLGLWTVLGCNHRLDAARRPHNSLHVISDRGVVSARYDKRLCSANETANHYSPGSEPVVFAVDGFRFGCALCIEVNFPELFLEYERLDVDCVLFSSHSQDAMFGVLAQAHAAANNYWLGVSVPAQYAGALPAGVIGPDGYWIVRCGGDPTPALALARLDRSAPQYDIALNKARPWRRAARDGRILAGHGARDPGGKVMPPT